MLVNIFVSNIVMGRMTWAKVPRLLKKQVAEQLIAIGCEFLIDEEERKEYVGR